LRQSRPAFADCPADCRYGDALQQDKQQDEQQENL